MKVQKRLEEKVGIRGPVPPPNQNRFHTVTAVQASNSHQPIRFFKPRGNSYTSNSPADFPRGGSWTFKR